MSDDRPAEASETRSNRTVQTRTVYTPSTGTKVGILLGAVLVLACVYYLLAPVYYLTGGGVLQCGSALFPVDTDFARNTCNGLPNGNLYKALLAGLAGLVAIFGSNHFFGGDRRREQRVVDEDDDLD